MTTTSDAADTAHTTLDEVTRNIERGHPDGHLFDPASVPGLQQSMDAADELTASTPPTDGSYLQTVAHPLALFT